MRETTIITKRARATSWEEIILAINAGKARDILSEGDQISLVLEEGSAKERRMFVSVAKVKEDGVYCVTDDLVDNEVAMYEGIPRTPVSWSGSDARAYLNSDVLAMFPDILKINIMPRGLRSALMEKSYIHRTSCGCRHIQSSLVGRMD